MSVNSSIDKQIMVYSCKEIHSAILKSWTTDEQNSEEESHRHYLEWKELNANEYILYNSIFVNF